jgi:hypothetical protein
MEQCGVNVSCPERIITDDHNRCVSICSGVLLRTSPQAFYRFVSTEKVPTDASHRIVAIRRVLGDSPKPGRIVRELIYLGSRRQAHMSMTSTEKQGLLLHELFELRI